MEFASIERELYIEAEPEVVYDVVSRPEHLALWWPDEADFEPGGRGHIRFGDGAEAKVETFCVVAAQPPRLFSFRWTYPENESPTVENSFLVTFELTSTEDGTLLRMTETGFRERGWEAAVLEAAYHDHVSGWDYFLPRLAPYVATLAPRR